MKLLENAKLIEALQENIRHANAELLKTQIQLQEANETLDAIRSGTVDALVVKQDDQHQIFTLKSADHTFRIFIEQLRESVITLGPGNQILYCNSSFAELIEVPLEKVMGRGFCEFFSDRDKEVCGELVTKGWESESREELHLITAAKKEVAVLASCKRLDVDENIALSVILTDLTVQKAQQIQLINKNKQLEDAEKNARYLNSNLEKMVKERTSDLQQSIHEKILIGEELRSNQQRLAQILETMAEGVIIMNIEGGITYANRMAQQVLELKETNADGKMWYMTELSIVSIDGVKLKPEEHPVYVSMQTGQSLYDYEIGIQLPASEIKYISFNTVPVYEDKVIIGAIGTFMDVTRRRIAIQQKDDFIGVASHELKTPITTIKASLQLLERFKTEPTNEMVPKLIDQANRGMKKLNYLVDDLLDVSKLKEGQLSMKKERFYIIDMVNDSIEYLNIHNLVKINVSGDPTLEVTADRQRIEQVIVNFINNAIKYAPNSKSIDIGFGQFGNMVRITVTDQGPGIDLEKQEFLFNRYFRTDYSGIQYSGLGLGLYISSEIIRKHGGSIGVESKPDNGSTFWFTLPE